MEDSNKNPDIVFEFNSDIAENVDVVEENFLLNDMPKGLRGIISPDINEAIPLASKTATWPERNIYSNSGKHLFTEGVAKITLIRARLSRSPYWRLYSTYISTMTSEGWKVRPPRGGRNPVPAGYFDRDLYLKNASGGLLADWGFRLLIQCDWRSKPVSQASGDFAADFYDDVAKANRSHDGRNLIRC